MVGLRARSVMRFGIAFGAAVLVMACSSTRPHSMPKPQAFPLPPAPIDLGPVAPQPIAMSANSLYAPAQAGLFQDLRARREGDILTVLIDIDDEARLDNSTRRSRSGEAELGLGSLFGLEQVLDKALHDGFDASSAIGVNGSGSSQGEGAIQRRESIDLKIAVVVQQRLTNGNLVIAGRQQVGVNGETRELLVAGIVRPSDINADNTIDYDKIAEARLSYGGRGVITAGQGPRWGQRVVDATSPF